ncbi:MAG: rubrerythrin family protein [Thermoplasmata archaeon]|nr:rubrerythrin family protein [Thermoplasmata archaeon]
MKKMTEKALQEAFLGESMAHIKYLIYASIAEKEEYKNIARLFRAIAYAEFVHATNHAKALGMIEKTGENLIRAKEGEIFEVEEMYPVYLQTAKMQDEKDADIGEIYICPVCGYKAEFKKF